MSEIQGGLVDGKWFCGDCYNCDGRDDKSHCIAVYNFEITEVAKQLAEAKREIAIRDKALESMSECCEDRWKCGNIGENPCIECAIKEATEALEHKAIAEIIESRKDSKERYSLEDVLKESEGK